MNTRAYGEEIRESDHCKELRMEFTTTSLSFPSSFFLPVTCSNGREGEGEGERVRGREKRLNQLLPHHLPLLITLMLLAAHSQVKPLGLTQSFMCVQRASVYVYIYLGLCLFVLTYIKGCVGAWNISLGFYMCLYRERGTCERSSIIWNAVYLKCANGHQLYICVNI
jgi:hypothetical protein